MENSNSSNTGNSVHRHLAEYIDNLLSSLQATKHGKSVIPSFLRGQPRKEVVHQIDSFLPTWHGYFFFSVKTISDHFDICVGRDSLLTLVLGAWSWLCVVWLLFLFWRLASFFFVFLHADVSAGICIDLPGCEELPSDSAAWLGELDLRFSPVLAGLVSLLLLLRSVAGLSTQDDLSF